MSKIHLLSPEISNKIAAGEVVERPVSVVKELIENSIDAGADKITIEITNGGISKIVVMDNGCGMSAEDAQIAFLRHATSKIQKEEDLDAIFTLGFRGEALSSIGAVSECAIYTKRKEDKYGTVVLCEGGEIIASDEGGMSDGTKVIVNNLFYNTPARMKFLKKDATEAGYISDIITRFVVSYPQISFRFIKNGKDVILSSGDGVLKNAIYAVYGRDYAENVIDVDYESEGIRVIGVVGKNNLSRPNRNFQSYFVNNRFIKSPLITRAVEEAYKNIIMIGKFPLAVLNIKINPIYVDINVHPTKLEAKFSDEKKIYDAVYYGVKSALYATEKVKEKYVHNPRINPFLMNVPEKKFENAKKPEVEENNAKNSKTQDINVNQNTVEKKSYKESNRFLIKDNDPLSAFRKKDTDDVSSKRMDFNMPSISIPLPKTKKEGSKNVEQILIGNETVSEEGPSVKICGQVFDTYIIAEIDGKMVLFDQHAAHERIKYEQLLTSIQSKNSFSQMLLESEIVKMGGEELSVFEANKELFDKLGFDAEVFGENEIIVRATPQEVEYGEVEDLFVELISHLMSSKKEIITDKLQRMIYTIACKAAIKANHKMNESEMKALVISVIELKNINTCPHGRPITVEFTKRELEKMFKRIV